MRRPLLLLVVAAAAASLPLVASADPAAPYQPPPWAKKCHVRHFGEAVAPPVTGYPDDPLCVDYAKRDITVDNGGAVRFLLAEPARFAIAARPCRYWQQDHWSVQLDRSYAAVVRWDGSYWWDKGRGVGGAVLRNFTVFGQPAGPTQAAAAVATVSPQLAGQIKRYGAGPGGGGGVWFSLGGGQPGCPTR